MKIVIAGGTGFLGGPLARSLAADRHEVVILTRRARLDQAPAVRYVGWNPDGTAGQWAAEIDGAHGLVNLAGNSIAARRWSDAHKQRILQSRVDATRSLVAAIRGAAHAPQAFVSATAVGYYGPLGAEIVTEDHPPGSDFLASVCRQWESEAARAASASTRVVCLRTGLVIEKDGGALPQMLPPFKFGIGGPLGSGRQYWPWIHRRDWVALARWTIDTPNVDGPVNATAPNPVTNLEFSKSLGRVLRRPALLPVPAFVLRMALGEMADALLLAGQRAVPARAQQLGFRFGFTHVDDALRAIFGR
jgi:uncharacterized protein (TIGR01777 family)